MSRAFVKDDDGGPPPPPLERPVSSAPNRVTARGARLIEETLANLEKALAADPGEEGAAGLRRDLRYWTARHASMRIEGPGLSPSCVAFGTRVTIQRGGVRSQLTVVGEDEADPAKGLIAWTAPLARALDGAEVGETVDFAVGGRPEEITVLAITADEGC